PPPRPPLFPYTTLFRSDLRPPTLAPRTEHTARHARVRRAGVAAGRHLLLALQRPRRSLLRPEPVVRLGARATRDRTPVPHRARRSEEHTSELQSRSDLV